MRSLGFSTKRLDKPMKWGEFSASAYFCALKKILFPAGWH
jgi:hypothetical protein